MGYRFPGETELKAQDHQQLRKIQEIERDTEQNSNAHESWSGEDDVKEFEDKTAHFTQATLRRGVKYC